MKLLIIGSLLAFSVTSFADANLGINEETEEMNEVITGPTRAEGEIRDPVKRQAIRGWDNIGNLGPTRAQGFVDPAKRQAIYGGIPANYEDSEE